VDRVEDGFEYFIGDFEYEDGLPVGTVREFRFTSGDNPIYRIASANIDVLELRRIAGSDDPQEFLAYIFRADDRLIGANLDDAMAGYVGDDLLRGREGSDRLMGMAGDDTIFGGIGRDALFGGNGDDWLDGGRGSNRLSGGAGRDTFVFRDACKPDKITDFTACDRIGLGFPGLGPDGALDPAAFHRGVKADNPDQHILYDGDTGWLRYAAEGSDTRHPETFAWIGKGLDHLGADDFFVI
jgi:Ca2+-binding RTX toxin-like protein